MIYSSSAARMNMRHAMIHLTIEVAFPLAIGVLLATELRVFTVQRNRSKSRAIRPGMASGVIRKLICKLWQKKEDQFLMRSPEARYKSRTNGV